MAKRANVSIRTKQYTRFRGVDFSSDPSLVDDSRSPWAVNLISDRGGMPEKRPGWKTITRFDGSVNGIFFCEFDDELHRIVHAGDKLLRWYEDGTESTVLCEGLPEEKSMAVYMDGCLWIFTGAGLYRYDGETAKRASEDAYVPLTVIASAPAGGGVSYEGVNFLTPRQRVRFLPDGTTKIFQLPYDAIDAEGEVTVRTNTGGNGWEIMTENYTVQHSKGTVTFTTAPKAPAAGEEDNLEIEFSKTLEGHSDRIDKCRTAIVWGVDGASDRIVAAGNPDFPNQDYICGFSDGTYWPADKYFVVGTADTAIMGYRRWGEALTVIKEDNGQDSTVFIRTGALDSTGEAVFSVMPCLAGVGGVSRFGFGNIGNEQMYLTRQGVVALTNNVLTAEKITQNRSFRVDPKLLTENLSEAVGCSFDGNYMLFVGGRVYVLDGRNPKSYPNRQDSEFYYECFYWDNVPARCVGHLVRGGEEFLYFGTADGRLCRFKTEETKMGRFSDDGEAICAIWSTKSDDDGDPMVLKTLLKKGNAVTLKPYSRSGAKILIRTDKDAVAWQAAEGTMDIFDWEDIDFSRFTFSSNDAPSEIPINRKVKNYKRLQFVVKNDAVNEGFGVFGVVKHFVTGNFAKR